MKKRISEMTPADKAAFLEATKLATERQQKMPWKEMEKRIRAEIEATFNDELFARMEPGRKIDAFLCRMEFGSRKPELVDYMLWSLKLVTNSDVVEW